MVRNALIAKSFLVRSKVKEELHQEHENMPFGKMSLEEKLFFILDFPFVWIRKISVPPGEEHHYNNWQTVGWPFLGIPIMSIIITKNLPSLMFMGYNLIFAIPWAGFFYYSVKDPHEAPEKWFILIAFVAMLCGFIWTYFISGMLIDLLTLIGLVTKLSPTYIALTIIAVGNALPDALITIKLSSKG